MKKKINFKEKISILYKYESLAIIFFIIQLILLVVVNFTRNSHRIDYDSATAYRFSVEIWKARSILPENWEFQTTLAIDTPAILAALFFGVFKDIFIAYSLANVIFIILYVYVFYRILKLIEIPKTVAYLVLSIMLIPFSAGQLGYFTVLFSSSFFYAMRVLTPLLILMITLSIRNGNIFRKELPWIFLTLLFCFFTAFSSGILILITGILPFLFYEIMETLSSNKLTRIKNKYTYFYLFCILISLLGIFLQSKFIAYNQLQNVILTHNVDTFADNILDIFIGFFQLFGGLESRKILSTDGILQILKTLFTILIFIVVGKYAIAWFKNKKTKYHVKIIFSILFINLFIFIFSKSFYNNAQMEFRYLTILVLPLFFLLAEYIYDIIKFPENKFLIKRFFLTIFSISIVFISFVSYKNLFQSDNMFETKMMPMFDNIMEMNPDTVIINSNRITDTTLSFHYAKEAIIYYPEQEFIIIYPDQEDAIDSWGISTSKFDVGSRKDNTVLVIDHDSFAALPKYIKTLYNFAFYDEINNLEVYTTKVDPRDFLKGLPQKSESRSIDNPSTLGLELMGITVDTSSGKYIIKKGNKPGIYFLLDNMPTQEGVFNIYINYKASINSPDGEESRFILSYRDEEKNILKEDGISLSEDTKQIAFFNVHFSSAEKFFSLYCINVEKNEVEIEYIEYVKVDDENERE